jgi:hypothetical protein
MNERNAVAGGFRGDIPGAVAFTAYALASTLSARSTLVNPAALMTTSHRLAAIILSIVPGSARSTIDQGGATISTSRGNDNPRSSVPICPVPPRSNTSIVAVSFVDHSPRGGWFVQCRVRSARLNSSGRAYQRIQHSEIFQLSDFDNRQFCEGMPVIRERTVEVLERRKSSILIGFYDIGFFKRPRESDLRIIAGYARITRR